MENPFQDPLGSPGLSDGAPEGDEGDEGDVQAARVRERLAALRPGTRIVTLHGFGGVMPPSYALLYHERVPVYGLDLVLWVQGAAARREWGLS